MTTFRKGFVCSLLTLFVATLLNLGIGTIPAHAADTTGTLSICKVAGDGVTAGTTFTFYVGDHPVTVAAGACLVLDGSRPIGTVVAVREQAVTDLHVTAIAVDPAERRLRAADLHH